METWLFTGMQSSAKRNMVVGSGVDGQQISNLCEFQTGGDNNKSPHCRTSTHGGPETRSDFAFLV